MLDKKARHTIFILKVFSGIEVRALCEPSSFTPQLFDHVYMGLALRPGAWNRTANAGILPSCSYKVRSKALSKMSWYPEAFKNSLHWK